MRNRFRNLDRNIGFGVSWARKSVCYKLFGCIQRRRENHWNDFHKIRNKDVSELQHTMVSVVSEVAGRKLAEKREAVGRPEVYSSCVSILISLTVIEKKCILTFLHNEAREKVCASFRFRLFVSWSFNQSKQWNTTL